MVNDLEANRRSERTEDDQDSVAEAAYRRGYQQGAAYVVQLMKASRTLSEIEGYAHSLLSDWRYRTPLVPRRDAPDLRGK